MSVFSLYGPMLLGAVTNRPPCGRDQRDGVHSLCSSTALRRDATCAGSRPLFVHSRPTLMTLFVRSCFSWELGTRSQALLELNANLYSVLSNHPLPPPSTIPTNLA